MGSPALRPLVIPRLINTLLNSFAVRGQNANLGKDVYLFGDASIIPPLDGAPCWVYCEFNTLGSLKTGRTRLTLPDGFVLLNYFGSATVNTNGGFRVNVYDVDRRLRLMERPVNLQTLAGTGNSPLFQGGNVGSRIATPYRFAAVTPQAYVTIVNLEPNPNIIQFGMYGLQGSSGRLK